MSSTRGRNVTGSNGARSASRSRKRAVTPEDLHTFQYVADPQISPDGQSVVFTHKTVGEKNKYATNLWMVSTATRPENFFASTGFLTSMDVR